MAASRLILIEGMIGSGKTTTAERLRDWLSGRGENVRAFGEGAADHPIRTRRVDELLSVPAPGDPGAYSASRRRESASPPASILRACASVSACLRRVTCAASASRRR